MQTLIFYVTETPNNSTYLRYSRIFRYIESRYAMIVRCTLDTASLGLKTRNVLHFDLELDTGRCTRLKHVNIPVPIQRLNQSLDINDFHTSVVSSTAGRRLQQFFFNFFFLLFRWSRVRFRGWASLLGFSIRNLNFSKCAILMATDPPLMTWD